MNFHGVMAMTYFSCFFATVSSRTTTPMLLSHLHAPIAFPYYSPTLLYSIGVVCDFAICWYYLVVLCVWQHFLEVVVIVIVFIWVFCIPYFDALTVSVVIFVLVPCSGSFWKILVIVLFC